VISNTLHVEYTIILPFSRHRTSTYRRSQADKRQMTMSFFRAPNRNILTTSIQYPMIKSRPPQAPTQHVSTLQLPTLFNSESPLAKSHPTITLF
jgi:hypothetical protein